MATNYVLVDFENLQPDMSGLAGTAHKVLVFFGAKQQSSRHHYEKFVPLLRLAGNLEVVEVPQTGDNALDMHIAFTIGGIFQREPDATIVVISRDKDFDPLIDTLQKRGFKCSRTHDVNTIAKKRAAPAAVPAMGAVPRKGRTATAGAARRVAPTSINVDPIVKKLRSMADKPATRKSLAKDIANHLKQRRVEEPEKAAELVIDELIRRDVVSQNGGKVNYHLD
jgi:hypothetical protein